MRFYSCYDSTKAQEYFNSFFASSSFHFFNNALNFEPSIHCKKFKKRFTKRNRKFNFNHADILAIVYWKLLFHYFKRSSQRTINNLDLKKRYAIITKFGYSSYTQLLS